MANFGSNVSGRWPVFVYLCICVFVYLCICVFEIDLSQGKGLVPMYLVPIDWFENWFESQVLDIFDASEVTAQLKSLQ